MREAVLVERFKGDEQAAGVLIMLRRVEATADGHDAADWLLLHANAPSEREEGRHSVGVCWAPSWRGTRGVHIVRCLGL